MIAIILALIGILAFAVFAVVAYLLARAQADKGLMSQMPANAFPAKLDFGAATPNVVECLLMASEWWQKQLGIEAFVTEDTEGVVVMIEETRAIGFYARTTFIEDKLVVLLLVNTRAVDRDSGKLFRAMCHELGHVLGLDHDADPESVMYPKTLSGDFRVTDKDLELVRNRIWQS